jgi:WD40 repeat protein
LSKSVSPQSQKDNNIDAANNHCRSPTETTTDNRLGHDYTNRSHSNSFASIDDATTNTRPIGAPTSQSSPLGSILTRGRSRSRIRRIQQSLPHVRPRPEVLTDCSALSLPGLQHQKSKSSINTLSSIESRNDHEINNNNNKHSTMDSSTTSLTSNTKGEETTTPIGHFENNGDDADTTSVPILRSNPGNVDQTSNSNGIVASNPSLEEMTEQILLEALRQTSCLTFDADRPDEILREARVEASSIRVARMNAASSISSRNNDRTVINGSVRETLNSPSRRAERTPTKEENLNLATDIDSPVVGIIAHNRTDDFTSPFSIKSVGSIDDFETAVEKLPSRLKYMNTDDFGKPLPQEKMLSRLDGTDPSSILTRQHPSTIDQTLSELSMPFEAGNSKATKRSTRTRHAGTADIVQVPIKPVIIQSMEVAAEQPDEINTVGSWFTYFMASASKDDNDRNHEPHDSNGDGTFPLACGSPISRPCDTIPSVINPPAQAADSGANGDMSYPEAFRASHKANPVLSDWVDNKFMPRERLPNDGTYRLGESKTILVHEILRGNWTWCTAWSPDGSQLAIATENHHLAVVDTTSSSVWRIRHDRRVTAPPKMNTTQSIRSIAWGDHFIAIGGIGNAVSILAPTEPYQILHTITPTGFVGSIAWLPGSNKLLIGSRNGKATIHEIWENHNIVQSFQFPSTQAVREIKSKTIHTIDRGKAWVNSVQFKPGETYFAMGDSHGVLAVYSFEDALMMELTNVANFKLEDCILDIQWSSDGSYLYAGGEDFAITVISTQYWEPVHKIKRDRWVQFISSSQSSSHVAVGGVKSEVSILDVNNGWDNIINISLKGLVPLSANWHPDDQYLVLTGQDNSILAIETTDARHVSGHFLRSSYPILSIAFSPDGRMAAIGNEMGVVSIFELSDTTFVSVYEMVVDCSGSLSIEWSPNGSFVVIAAGNKVVVIGRSEMLPGSAPPNTSGFFVAKVIRDTGPVNDVSIDPTSRFLALSGTKTRVLGATSNFKNVLQMENGGTTLANSWSHDGKWFAAIGKDHSLVIYDTSYADLSRWQSVFTVKTEGAGLALAWGRSSIVGLQYCAYGGEDKKIHIMEIRTKERTWESVLAVPRDGEINGLDWNSDGLLAAAVSNGTVTVLDLSYLQLGWAVNEMDYNWQRQALTCFTEIRRNRGKHSMKSVKWIPSEEESDNFLAIGGTDGELEIIDLTERDKCKGFQKNCNSI